MGGARLAEPEAGEGGGGDPALPTLFLSFSHAISPRQPNWPFAATATFPRTSLPISTADRQPEVPWGWPEASPAALSASVREEAAELALARAHALAARRCVVARATYAVSLIVDARGCTQGGCGELALEARLQAVDWWYEGCQGLMGQAATCRLPT